MLPILIVPDRWGELADALPSGDVRDSAPRYWVATREAQVRIYCRLSREIEIRHKLPAIPRPNMAAPASLKDCELLLKLFMRRKADALGRRDRADIGRALHATRPITDSMMTLSPSVATWLLWAMSWRGVSTARQIASPPLQIGITDFVKRTERDHHCKVLYTEHSWHDPVADQGGFIDLIIVGVESKCIFVVECKRVLDTSWIFLTTTPITSMRRYAKLWVTKKGTHSGPLSLFGWAHVPLEPRTPESGFCVVNGQDERSRPMLERVASELISATEIFAHEDSVRVKAKPRKAHF